jgi:hypothetical protein
MGHHLLDRGLRADPLRNGLVRNPGCHGYFA